MMPAITMRKALGTAAAALLCLLLAACLITPGKFTSALDVRKDGRFTFSYVGEIYLLPFAKPQADAAKFEAKPCHDDGSFEDRPCTAAELAQQKVDWQAERKRQAEQDRKEADSARMMFGGIDPSDPKAAEELAVRLRKQAGWRKVIYRGNGLYDVDFSMAGHLDRDFAFPTIERFPMANAFVQIAVHQDGTVRIDAPSFGPSGGSVPMQAMIMGAMADATKTDAARMPVPDGVFTLRSDAAFLANNTEEGPQADPAGQRLEWTVNVRTAAAPTALLQLAR